MKLMDIPYKRPDVDAMLEKCAKLTVDFEQAASAEEQLAVLKEFETEKAHYETYSCLSNIRNSCDTQDPFYIEEQAFYDKYDPIATQCFNNFTKKIIDSKFQDELRKVCGNYFFDCLEMNQKTFSPAIMDLMAEENELCSQYEQLYASARIDFGGKICNVSQLSAFRQSPDREVRKAAVEAEGKFFDSHQDQIEEIYDRLVKNRTEQARILGYDNFVDLAYVRRHRSYTKEDVAKFRQQVLEVMVPKNVEYKKKQAADIGIEDFKFYDNDFFFADGNPMPKCDTKEMLKLAQKMFGEMSPETKELIDLMIENDLFDIEARNGKRNAGYCTTIEDYGYPFIFSNSNGTSGDVNTLTHECGHALAAYTTQKLIELPPLRHAPMEACETHSMSMEFLTSPWHHLFFGEDTAKYSEHLAKGASYFIPYSVIVDYWQELVYTNPQWTKEERNQAWLELEKQFRPYLDFGDLPFYSRGAGWQRQIHITCMPFYYIDYSIAQTLALQFFALFLKDRKSTWEKYMKFVKIGGMMNIDETIAACDLISPFTPGGLKEILQPVYEWIDNL